MDEIRILPWSLLLRQLGPGYLVLRTERLGDRRLLGTARACDGVGRESVSGYNLLSTCMQVRMQEWLMLLRLHIRHGCVGMPGIEGGYRKIKGSCP